VEGESSDLQDNIKKMYPEATIVVSKSFGKDIGGTIDLMNLIDTTKYDLLCYFHTKRNNKWRQELLNPILGSPERIRRIIKMFTNQSVGMVGAKCWLRHKARYTTATTRKYKHFCSLAGISKEIKEFIGGTMFWSRIQLIREIQHLNFKGEHFECDPAMKDSTWNHAMERFFSALIQSCDYKLIGLD
jgi:lipopolysaccharide biosynthesis protein